IFQGAARELTRLSAQWRVTRARAVEKVNAPARNRRAGNRRRSGAESLQARVQAALQARGLAGPLEVLARRAIHQRAGGAIYLRRLFLVAGFHQLEKLLDLGAHGGTLGNV